MKNLSKVLAITIFMGFGLFVSLTSFPQALSAVPPGNPPTANVSPTFTGLTVNGTSALKSGLTVSGGTTTVGTLSAGAATLSSGTVNNNLNVTGTTTSGTLTTGGNLTVTGTSTLGTLNSGATTVSSLTDNGDLTVFGAINLSGLISNNYVCSIPNKFLGICTDAYNDVRINDNLRVYGNLSVNGITTLGNNKNEDIVTVNGDLKGQRFIRAYVDDNGMGGIGRYYNKSKIQNIGASTTFSESHSCDGKDMVISCNGGFLNVMNNTYIVNGLYRSDKHTCTINGYNASADAADVTVQAICYAPDENWYYGNGSWRVMNYDGTLSDPIGL